MQLAKAVERTNIHFKDPETDRKDKNDFLKACTLFPACASAGRVFNGK